jgi:L-type amino acid transporter 9
MTIAAANQKWLPHFLAIVGRVGIKAPSTSESDAPLNALLLSTVLSTLYILFGNFRALLTFNGLGEYSFFFLTVVGAIVLRIREPDLPRPYKTLIIIPGTFVVVSGFIVVRGAVFAPIQTAVLVALWVVGAGFYQTRKLWMGNLEGE